MPWLSEEIPDWEELSEEERDVYRQVIRDIGMSFPDEEEADYYE
jgi:ribonucleotide reductase beta subunit family protein with ferritin-like domain